MENHYSTALQQAMLPTGMAKSRCWHNAVPSFPGRVLLAWLLALLGTLGSQAQTATKVYWTQSSGTPADDRLSSANLDGSSNTTLASGNSASTFFNPQTIDIDVANGVAYVGDGALAGSTGISRFSLAGAFLGTIVAGSATVAYNGVQVVGSRVYWVQSSNTPADDRLCSANLDGSGVSILASGNSTSTFANPQSLWVDAANNVIYVGDGANASSTGISRFSLTGTFLGTIVAGSATVGYNGVQVVGSRVYWVQSSGTPASDQLSSANLNGSGVSVLASGNSTSTFANPQSLLVDVANNVIYVGDGAGAGSTGISRFSLTGTFINTIVAGSATVGYNGLSSNGGNANTAPTDITLSNNLVAENQASGTAVGTFTSTDADLPAQTFTYSLVSGTGSTDNASFSIVGSQLRTAAIFDFETKSSYSIRVRTTDSGTPSATYDEVFTITVTNVNEAPTAIALSNNTVAENTGANAVVGTLSSTDPDAAQTFTYTLVTGTGSTDNALVNISSSSLRITASPNYEAKSSYAVRVRTTDQNSLFTEQAFTITITDVNEAPTDIALSSNSVAENLAVNSTVGTLSSTDADLPAQTFTYALVSGTGSTDNASFNLSANTLRTSAIFDFETKSSYSIRVRTTDQGSLFSEKVFTINVTNVNEAPTANNDVLTVVTNSGATFVSVLANDTDPDASTTLTVTAVTQPANGTVTLTGGVVRFTPSAGFGGTTTFTYTISDGALTATATVTVSVTPANDNCAGAIALTSTPNCTGTSGTVAGATQSRAPSSCSNFTAPTANDVWYSFVATGPSHSVQASSAFDGVLEVFSGSCAGLASLGCSDQHVENSSETISFSSLTAGTTYYVRYYPYSNIASTSFTICVTAPAPTATITSTASSPTSTSPIPVTVTFSLPVTGFGAAGVAVGNGTLSGFTAVNATTYTFNITPTASGAVTVNVAANAAQDGAGNGNTAATPFSIAYVYPTTNWTGAVSNDWYTAGNWSAGVPTATKDAVLNLVNGWTPYIYSGTATAHSCTVGGSYFLTLQGGTLDLKGNFTVNGYFSMSSGTQVLLSGTSPQTIGGSATPQIYNLTVGAAGASLTGNITMLQLLTLNGGLTTGSYKVTLDASATLSETETNYVTGAVEATRTLSTAGTGNNFGGLGLVLTPAVGSPALPGSTLVRRVTGTTTIGVNSNQGIKRYFVITPAVDANLNVTMALSYFDHELPGGINEAHLLFYKSETPGATGPWAPAGITSRNPGQNTMTKTGITSLSTWTLGSYDTPLPVELTDFTAAVQNNDALLRWTTASEADNASFEVESSRDGREFQRIGSVPGHGSSAQAWTYQLLDKNVARYAADLLYYRLRQVDTDGTSTYSPVRTLLVAHETGLQAQLYPNPTHPAETLTLLVRTAQAGPASWQLTDGLGRVLRRASAELPLGSTTLALPIAGLSTGVYLLQLQQGSQHLVRKLVVE